MRIKTCKAITGGALCVFCLFIFATPGLAKVSPPELNKGVRSPFINVADAVRDSVVYISGVSEADHARDCFYNAKDRVPSGGSGFIFKQEGDTAYILTNNHVIAKAKTVEVTLADKSLYTAKIKGMDPKTDLAVLTIQTDRKLKVVSFGDSDQVRVGAWTIAIGNPMPHLEGRRLVNFHDRTLTVGVVSGKGRSQLYFGEDDETPFYQDYIQTDAAINGGNSGGPLFDIHARVIGVNAAISTMWHGGNVGIAFAIPSNLAQKVAQDIMEHGRVIRAYLGFVPQELDAKIARAMNLDSTSGILVVKVPDETPAGKAGLKKGDIITGFEGVEISDLISIKMLVAHSKIGKTVTMDILRQGKPMTLNPVLEEYPKKKLISSSHVPRSSNWLGIRVKEKGTEGVVIVGIEDYSRAENSDLRKGDVILEVEGVTVKDWDDFKEAAKKFEDKDDVLFYVKRRKINLFVGVGR